MLAHVLDFDDLHMESTTHISAVCVPAALAVGGDARAYLAGAGVMARLGGALGWPHYAAGWHATCTAGAPAAAAAAATALGPRRGGGRHRDGAGRARRRAACSAPSARRPRRCRWASRCTPACAPRGWPTPARRPIRAPWTSGSGWWAATRTAWPSAGPAVPGGLAVKLFPCCYALQRPIAALLAPISPTSIPRSVARVVVRTPESALAPLIHAAPATGLEGKFSLQYAIAATLLDGRPGIESFTDEAVARPAAQALLARVEVDAIPGGDWLLAGDVAIELMLDDGSTRHARLDRPPGAPDRPPSRADLAAKVADCAGDQADEILAVTWDDAGALLREWLPARALPRA